MPVMPTYKYQIQKPPSTETYPDISFHSPLSSGSALSAASLHPPGLKFADFTKKVTNHLLIPIQALQNVIVRHRTIILTMSQTHLEIIDTST